MKTNPMMKTSPILVLAVGSLLLGLAPCRADQAPPDGEVEHWGKAPNGLQCRLLPVGQVAAPSTGEMNEKKASMPFDALKVILRCNWYGGSRREIVVRSDGQAAYAMLTQQDETKYRSSFVLSAVQREALVRCLEATRWLNLPPEKSMADDAVEYELVLNRKGRTTKAEFMVQRKLPYQALEMFLNGLDRQEQQFYQLTASSKDHRVDAARNIQNELSSRMKHPGRARAVHLKDIDYTRFVPVLIPWLKEREKHGTDEMAAAIDLVSYLKLESQRENVEALMGLHTYSNWNCVCECLVRLGDPGSIPVLRERAMKSGAGAACWALIRMGKPAHGAICEVLRIPPNPNLNPAYKMVRVYLDHFHELPEPVAPAIVEAIRAARRDQTVHPISEYGDRLLRLIDGGKPVRDLRVTIVPEKPEYAPGEPVLVGWKIENTGDQARTIFWHPLHYSPVVFSFMKPGGVAWIRADLRRNIINELPSPPKALVLQPGESHEASIDLRHFLPDGPSSYVIAGYYWPRAKEAGIPAEFLNDPMFGNAALDRIGSKVARIVVLRKPRTAEEETREAERHKLENERLHREAEEAKRRAIEKARKEQAEQDAGKTGEVGGVLLGHDGGPVPQATVVLCDQETGIPVNNKTFRPFVEGKMDIKGLAVMLTDDNGEFHMQGVPGGRYRLIAQSWAEKPGVTDVFEKNSREIILRGVADDIRVPSQEAQQVTIKAMGDCVVTLDEDFPNSDALLVIGTSPLSADPVLGFVSWQGAFLQGMLGANRMPKGVTKIGGLPEGEIHLSVFANDNNGGIGAGSVTATPGEAVRADYIPIVCGWSNGRHEPPAEMMTTFKELREVAAREKNFLVPFIDRLLAEKGVAVDRSKKTRNPMSQYFAHLDVIVSLPSGSKVRFADVLASMQYIRIQGTVEKRRKKTKFSGEDESD